MTRLERTREILGDPNVHYNCAQATLGSFCEECGIDFETAVKLGQHFGRGMRRGNTCGCLTGGLMALGLMGFDDEGRKEFFKIFEERHGNIMCAKLLVGVTPPVKPHCDGLIQETVKIIEEMLEKRNAEK